MHFSQTAALALVAALSQVSAHGVITSIQGANGVNMAGLSVIDGTPRDCATPGCGSEADTSIIRQGQSPLGRTKGAGDVDAASAIATFLGSKAAPAATNADNIQSIGGRRARRNGQNQARGLLGDLLGGLNGNKNQGGGNGATEATGQKTARGTVEGGVAQNAGKGATSGLPTPDANGVITMTLHQVNQDGAGPFEAAIDPTSGGTSEDAFQSAQVLQDVPGIGVGGLSGATTTDFTVKVQMPTGMKCTGSVGGATNVCIVRMKNAALAGPFGGSAAFTNPGTSSTAGTSTTSTTGSTSGNTSGNTAPQSTVLSSNNNPTAGQTASVTSSNPAAGDSSTITQSNGGSTVTTKSNGGDITATNDKRAVEFSA